MIYPHASKLFAIGNKSVQQRTSGVPSEKILNIYQNPNPPLPREFSFIYNSVFTSPKERKNNLPPNPGILSTPQRAHATATLEQDISTQDAVFERTLYSFNYAWFRLYHDESVCKCNSGTHAWMLPHIGKVVEWAVLGRRIQAIEEALLEGEEERDRRPTALAEGKDTTIFVKKILAHSSK